MSRDHLHVPSLLPLSLTVPDRQGGERTFSVIEVTVDRSTLPAGTLWQQAWAALAVAEEEMAEQVEEAKLYSVGYSVSGIHEIDRNRLYMQWVPVFLPGFGIRA